MPSDIATIRQHLKLLSIFQYTVAGLMALLSLLPVMHLAIGILMIMGNASAEANGGNSKWVGYIFVLIALVLIGLGLILAFLVFLTGRCLAKQKSHRFCAVIAGIECLFMPFGTILGVFTLIVLLKPETKALFLEPAKL